MAPTDSAPDPQMGGFEIGGWVADPSAGELRDGDRVVRLRPKTMALLVALASRPGETLPKQTLLDSVWPDAVVTEASVTVLIAELREALGDDPKRPEFIETIPHRGYRLIAQVSGPEDSSTPSLGKPSRFWLMGRGLQFVLAQGENIVGRAADAHVRLPSNRVSRRHARIMVDGDTVTVEDLGSKNGVFVGGDRVNEPTRLAHGDELRLGQMAATLRVVVADHQSTVTELSREEPDSDRR